MFPARLKSKAFFTADETPLDYKVYPFSEPCVCAVEMSEKCAVEIMKCVSEREPNADYLVINAVALFKMDIAEGVSFNNYLLLC